MNKILTSLIFYAIILFYDYDYDYDYFMNHPKNYLFLYLFDELPDELFILTSFAGLGFVFPFE